MNQTELKNRTKLFSHRCVKLALSLPKSDLGRHLSRQLIRCSTSVSANYRASCIAQSRSSFIAKISIVAEEVDKSNFWLEFIVDEKLLKSERVVSLLEESRELTSIFIASRKTASRSSDSKKIINYQ
jgi:four helix bundle protein